MWNAPQLVDLVYQELEKSWIENTNKLRSPKLDRKIWSIATQQNIQELVNIILECIRNFKSSWFWFEYTHDDIQLKNPDLELNESQKSINWITLDLDEWYVLIFLLDRRWDNISLEEFITFFNNLSQQNYEDTRKKLGRVIHDVKWKIASIPTLSITLNKDFIKLSEIDKNLVKRLRIGWSYLLYIVWRKRVINWSSQVDLDETETSIFQRIIDSSQLGWLRKNNISEEVITSINKKIVELWFTVIVSSKKYIITTK